VTNIGFRNVVTLLILTLMDEREFVHIQIVASFETALPGRVDVNVPFTIRTGDDEQAAFQIQIKDEGRDASDKEGEEQVDIEEYQPCESNGEQTATGAKMDIWPCLEGPPGL